MDYIEVKQHKNEYRICARCVMDTSDPEITFNDLGLCNHCRRVEANYVNKRWFPNDGGKAKLDLIIEKIKREGAGKEYDSIMGLSGGVDSCYMASLVKDYGLRPLVVHVDCGWNSEIAVNNIENVVKKLGFDLFTYVVDWEEMRDLQVAFMRSGVINQDIPQDHAIFAFLYNYAHKKGIRYVLSGNNYATESILPRAWVNNPMDLSLLKAVHKRYGRKKLRTYPLISYLRYCYYVYLKKMRVIMILNYLPYNKAEAKKVVQQELNWRDYGRKHHESRFTKFFQDYYLPQKYGYDKRRAHLSSLIVSGQITRDEALRQLEERLYPENELKEDRAYFIKKLGLTEDEFVAILNAPPKSPLDYSSDITMRKWGYKITSRLDRYLIKG